MERKWSRVREGVILGFCMYLLVLLPGCGVEKENVGDIVIEPYKLTERDKEIISLVQGEDKAWLFKMTAPETCNFTNGWAEIYKSGVLTDKVPVWGIKRMEDKRGPWVCKLGLRINYDTPQFSWECVIKDDPGSGGRWRHEMSIPDIKAGGYGALTDAVHLKPNDETILISFVYDTDGVRTIDNQAFLDNPASLGSYEYAILFKCNFSQEN